MTLDELKAKLPEAYHPWVETYGPAFLAMSVSEAQSWIERLIRGDVMTAYKAVLDKLDAEALSDEWSSLTADWTAANKANASLVELQKSAVVSVLKVMLTIALAAVGL